MIQNIYQDRSGDVTYPHKICSSGLFTCIAVGLYDKKLKRAYLIHEPNAFMDRNLPGFIDKVLLASSISDLHVWVTGAVIFDSESTEEKNFREDNRAYVEDIIRSRFTNEQTDIRWPENNKCVQMTIDTETGECEIIPKGND